MDNCGSPFGSVGTRIGYFVHVGRIDSRAHRAGRHRRGVPASDRSKNRLNLSSHQHPEKKSYQKIEKAGWPAAGGPPTALLKEESNDSNRLVRSKEKLDENE